MDVQTHLQSDLLQNNSYNVWCGIYATKYIQFQLIYFNSMCGGDVSRCHTSKKEYYECTDTMAQMKNKINEHRNVRTELYKCTHVSQWVYVGK